MPRDIWLPIPVEAVADRSVSLALRRKSGNNRPQRSRRRQILQRQANHGSLLGGVGSKRTDPASFTVGLLFRGPTDHSVRDIVDNPGVPLDFGSDRTFGGPMGPAVVKDSQSFPNGPQRRAYFASRACRRIGSVVRVSFRRKAVSVRIISYRFRIFRRSGNNNGNEM